MSPARFLLPTLLAVGSAYAQSCSVSATTTIQNSGDATGLASCTTFSGSIALATDAADIISLDGIQQLNGDLVAVNASNLKGLGSSSMTSIQGSLHLDGVTALNKLSFSKLGQVGTLTLNAVPNLDTLDFTAGVSKAGTIDIQNTKLGSLQGISLVMVDTMNIANNPYLTNVSMPLGNVTKSLTVSALTASLDVSLPNLIWASNLTFHNVSTVELPQLSSTNGSIGVYGLLNDTFAAPMLGDIGGALVLQDGTNIQNFNVPNVTQIGADFTIANCNKIGNITMPLLKKVGGAWDTHGNFSTLSTPALDDVEGTFNVQSTGDVQQTCDTFYKPLSSSKHIHGKYECQGSVAKAGGAGTTPSVTSSGSGSKKTGAASHMDSSKQAAMGLVGLAAAFFL